MPRTSQRISPREQRGAEYQNFQEGSQRQQQINAQSQAAMMQQLAGLLGIQQDQQMNPAKLAALQTDTASKQFETQHAPEILASKLAADKAQQDYYGQRAEPTLPHGFEYLPPDAQQIALEKTYPELRVQREKTAHDKTQANWMGIEQNARNFGVNPKEEGNIENQFGRPNLEYLRTLHQIPPSVAPQQNNAQVYGTALGEALKDKIVQAHKIFNPWYHAFHWLNKPYTE